MSRTKPNRTLGRHRRKGKPRLTKAHLTELRAKREDLGITLKMVADEAKKTARFGTCGVPTVSEALAKGNSRNIVEALRRLIAQAETRPTEAVAS